MPLFKPAKGAESLPALALLDVAEPSAHRVSSDSLEAMSRLVEMKLNDFGVEVEVVSVHPGPVITRFELQPAPGVKVSQITIWPRIWRARCRPSACGWWKSSPASR